MKGTLRNLFNSRLITAAAIILSLVVMKLVIHDKVLNNDTRATCWLFIFGAVIITIPLDGYRTKGVLVTFVVASLTATAIKLIA